MADDEYQRKLRDLKLYVPFLENTIRRLKSEREKPREAQISKLQSLLAILTDTKKKLKFEALKKCEEVILKLYDKVEKKPPVDTMHKYMCRNPPEEKSIPFNRTPIGMNEENTTDNEVSFSIARQKLHKQADLTTPASPSPPLIPQLLAPKPVVIPTEKVAPKNANTYFIPVVDSFKSNQTHRDYVEDGWCNNFDSHVDNMWQGQGYNNQIPLVTRIPPDNRVGNRFPGPEQEPPSDIRVTINNRPPPIRHNESPRNWLGNEQLYQRRNDVNRTLPNKFGIWKRMNFDEDKSTTQNREIVNYSDALSTPELDVDSQHYRPNFPTGIVPPPSVSVHSTVTKELIPELSNKSDVKSPESKVSEKRTPIRICFNKDKDINLPTSLNKPPLSESDLKDLLSTANESSSTGNASPLVNDDMDLDKLEELRRQISKELEENKKKKGKDKSGKHKEKIAGKITTPLTSPTATASSNTKPRTPKVVERVIKEQDNIFGNLLSSIDEQIMVKTKEQKKVEKKDSCKKEEIPKKDTKKSDGKDSKDKVDSKHKENKSKDDKHKDETHKQKDKVKSPKDNQQKPGKEDSAVKTSLNVKDVSKLNEKVKSNFLKEDSKSKDLDKNDTKTTKSKDESIFKEYSKHKDDSKSKLKHDSKHKESSLKSDHKNNTSNPRDSLKDNSKDKEKSKTPSKDEAKEKSNKHKDIQRSDVPETITKISDNCKSEQKYSDSNHSFTVSDSNSASSDKRDDDKLSHSNRISDKYPHKRKSSIDVQKSQPDPKPLDVISKFISERIPLNDSKLKIPNAEIHPIKLSDPRLRSHPELKSPTEMPHFERNHQFGDGEPNCNQNFQSTFSNENQNNQMFPFPQDNPQTMNQPNNFLCDQNIRPNMFPNEAQIGNRPIFPHEAQQMGMNFTASPMNNRFKNFVPEHPNMSKMSHNYNANSHQIGEFMNESQMMNRNLFPNDLQQAMNRPPSIESFHSSEMTPGDPFAMNNEPFPASNMRTERGKSPFQSTFNNHDRRNHAPAWNNNLNCPEQQYHMQHNQFNAGQNQGNSFPDRANMVSPDFNNTQARRIPNFLQNQPRFPGQQNQSMTPNSHDHFGIGNEQNFDNTQYDLSQMNPLDFYDQNQEDNPDMTDDRIPSLFDVGCEFKTNSNGKRTFRGRGVNRGTRGNRGLDRGGRGPERGGRGTERGGRGTERGGRVADRGNRGQFRWINPTRQSCMNEETQEEFPNRKFNSGSRFPLNDDSKGNWYTSSDEGKEEYLNRKLGNRFDDAKDEFANRKSDFRRRYENEDRDKTRSRFSSNDDKDYSNRKYGNRFSDDSKDGFSHRKFGSRFSGNEENRKSHSNKFSLNEDSSEFSERKYGNQRFSSSEEGKEDHQSRRFSSSSRFSSNGDSKEDQSKKSTNTQPNLDDSKEENVSRKPSVESTDKSSTKNDNKDKESVKSKEEIFSPLDSLYDPEKKKIGKGYGFQKFKIPKLKRTSIEEPKEEKDTNLNTETDIKTEDDKKIISGGIVKGEDSQPVDEKQATSTSQDEATDKNKSEADQKLETFNNFMKQLFETSDSSVFLQFLDRFGCSLPNAKTKRIRRIIESDSDETDDESKYKPEESTDKTSEIDAPVKTPEKIVTVEIETYDNTVVESVGERIKNRRRRKLDSSSESSPEKASSTKDNEEKTDKPLKTDIEVKACEDTGKKTARTKRRNALELLQDDIRDMFISEGVLTATGQRMCRMMKEHQDSVLNSSPSELDSPQLRKRDLMTTTDDEDLPLVRRRVQKKMGKSKVEKNKVEYLEAPRLYPKRLRSSPRVLLEKLDKLEKPDLVKYVTQEEAESSDNSSDNEPLIKEIKKSGRPLRRFDSSETAPNDSCSTSENVSPEKRRGRPASKKGKNKLVKEYKLDETGKESIGDSTVIPESPITDNIIEKTDDEPISGLPEDQIVAKIVKKAVGKKKLKRKNWAMGVIKKKPIKQISRRQPSPSFSILDVSDQLSVSETTNDPEMADVEMDTAETENHEAENTSDNEEYSLLTIDLTPDVNYFLDSGNKFICKLCDYKGKFIVHHYKFKHPESENMISRLSPEAANTAITEAADLDIASIIPFEEMIKNKKRRTTFCCRFCNLTLKQEYATNFFDHLTSHTGEYRFQCDSCTFYSGSRKALSAHINHEHSSYKKSTIIIPTFPAPPNFRLVFGYLCKACNFIQLLKINIEKHIKLSHPDQQVEIIKINLSTKSVVLSDLQGNRDEPETNSARNSVQTPAALLKPEQNKSETVELPKEPDMTVFMVPEDMSVREKLIEDERFRKMQEAISNITPRRSTLQFVDKLKTKLENAQIVQDLHEEITIEDVTNEEQIAPEVHVEEITPDKPETGFLEIKSTCSLAQTENDLNDSPIDNELAALETTDMDNIISDLIVESITSDAESSADTEEPIDVSNVELNLPTHSKQKGVINTIQRLAAQLQTSPVKTVPMLENDAEDNLGLESTMPLPYCDTEPEIQVKFSPGPKTQTQFDSEFKKQTPSELEPLQNESIVIPKMLMPASTLQPSDCEIIINVGPIEVRLNQKESQYNCMVEGCMFSTTYKISFTKHCSDQHQKLMFTCDICQKNSEPTRPCTMMSLFVHLFDKHKENSKPKAMEENDKTWVEPGKIRLRRISGDVLSTPSAEVTMSNSKTDAETQPPVQLELPAVNSPVPAKPNFLQIIDVRTLTPEEENLTYGACPMNSAETSLVKKVAGNSKFVFATKHVLIPVTEVNKFSNINSKATKIVKLAKANTGLDLNKLENVSAAAPTQTAIIKPSTSGSDTGTVQTAVVKAATGGSEVNSSNAVVKPRLSSGSSDDSNLIVSELKSFKKKEIYQEMLKLPKISELYKCPVNVCAYSTNMKKQFDSHFNSHNCAPMGYYCVYCMTLIRAGNLLGHIESKHGHCMFQCTFCFYRSIVASYVIIHQRKFHSKELVRVVQLPLNITKQFIGNVDKPISRKQTILPFLCNQGKCKGTFLIVDEFLSHMQTLHKWKILCSRCQVSCSYKTPAHLISHYEVHCIAMYQCRFCLFGSQKPDVMHDHYAISHPSNKPIAYVRQYKSGYIASSAEEDWLQEIEDVNLDKLNMKTIGTLSLPSAVPAPCIDSATPSTSTSVVAVAPNSVSHAASDMAPKKLVIESVLMNNSPKVSNTVIDVIDLSDDSPEVADSTCTETHDPAVFSEPLVTLKHRTVASSIAVANAVDPLNVDEPESSQNSLTLADAEPTIRIIDDISKFSEDPQVIEQPAEAKDAQETVKNADVSSDSSSDIACTKAVGYNGFTGSDLFKCGTTECLFQTSSQKVFKNHMYICDVLKVDEGWYTCIHCQKKFKLVGGLLEHLQVHGPLRFSCSYCAHRVPLGHMIARHMKKAHKIQTVRLVPVDPSKHDLNVDSFIANPTKTKLKKIKEVVELPTSVDNNAVAPVEDKNVFGPDDIDRLPRPPVYAQEIKCKLCLYSTKVRSNMQRHLQQHTDEKMVPDTAPVNPVPCLEKNEKMFDKMTNLAASSHCGRMGGKSGEKSEKGLTKDEETALPGFIPSNKRYVCGAEGCNYLTHGDSMLRHHFTALHLDETSYKCSHCHIELLTDIDGLAIDNILFHLKMHDLHLYKCSHCAFYHYQKHKLDKHLSDKHPDRIPYIHIIRELDNSANQQDTRMGTAVKATIDTQAELKPWRCGFCTYATSNRTDVQSHASTVHNIKSQFKCGLCQFRCSAKNNYNNHFRTKHPNCEINILSVYYKVTEENLVKNTIPEPVPEPETFDTTPLWSRDKPRIRHIRGILLDETKTTKKSTAKSEKAIVDLSKLGPETAKRSTENTKANEENASKLNSVEKDGKKPLKSNVFDATNKLPTDYGLPKQSFYVCPFCEKYKNKAVKEFVVHLYTEMNYYRCACSLCDFKSVDMNLAKSHWFKSHTKELKEENVIPLQPDGKIERWVEKCVQHQQKQMKNKDFLNSSTETVILEKDETSKLNIVDAEHAPLDTLEHPETPTNSSSKAKGSVNSSSKAEASTLASAETASTNDTLDSDGNLEPVSVELARSKCSTPVSSTVVASSSSNTPIPNENTQQTDSDATPAVKPAAKRLKAPVLNRLQCEYCPFIAKTIQTLRKHIKRHFIHKPFRCNCCKFQAIDKQTITTHFSLRHKQAQVSYTEEPAPDEPVVRPLKRKRYAKHPLERPAKILALDTSATLDANSELELDSKINNSNLDSVNLDKTERRVSVDKTNLGQNNIDKDADNKTNVDALSETAINVASEGNVAMELSERNTDIDKVIENDTVLGTSKAEDSVTKVEDDKTNTNKSVDKRESLENTEDVTQNDTSSGKVNEDNLPEKSTTGKGSAEKLVEKTNKGKGNKKKVVAKVDKTDTSEHIMYICYHCPRRSDSLDTIRTHFITMHEKVHKGTFKYKKLTEDKTKKTKKYNCKYCSWSGLPDGLKQHHMEQHNDQIWVCEKSTRFKCNDCQEIFPKVHLLRKHFIAMHPEAALSYQCVSDDGIDGDLLDNVVIMEELLDIKPEPKVFHCEYCPDTFQDVNHLWNHHNLLHSHLELKLESDELKKFKCPSCGHTSNSYPAMRDHLRSHNKPYKCHYCPLTGSYPSIIKTHHVKEHRTLEFKYDSNPDAKKMNEELRENLLVLGPDGVYHTKNPLKRQSTDLELPAAKIVAVASLADVHEPSTSSGIIRKYNVAKKSTSLPPRIAPRVGVAKKSTTPRFVKPQMVEGYSFYGSKPRDIDEYKNVMSEINIMGKSMPINVVAMSHVLNLFPKVVVEDFNKSHHS